MAQKFANAARAELAATINDTDTALTIVSGGGLFPVADTGSAAISSAADWFKLVLQDDSGYEIVHVRTHAADSASFSNIIRGQEGTTAREFLSGSVVGLRPTAGDAEAFVTGEELDEAQAAKQDRTISSDTAPIDPVDGQDWVDGQTGIKYTWVEDGTSGQWVELGPSGLPSTVVNSINSESGAVSLKTVGGVAVVGSGDIEIKTVNGESLIGSGNIAIAGTPDFLLINAGVI